MKEDLVSIVVPIYNVEKYLKECIDSIINQTYRNLEIILVNDGSTDNCKKICDEYAKNDKRIKVIHKKNGGLSSARNAGLDIATGEWISFIDSDDMVANNFIEKLYKLCMENDADIAVCNFKKFYNNVGTTKEETERIMKYSSIEMQERLCTIEYHNHAVVVWNKLYKMCIYEKLRFPVGKICEDQFTTHKAFENTNKDIIVTNESLYYYRYNENSIIRKKFNVSRLDVLDAYKEKKQYYYERNNMNLYEKTVIRYQHELKKYMY